VLTELAKALLGTAENGKKQQDFRYCREEVGGDWAILCHVPEPLC